MSTYPNLAFRKTIGASYDTDEQDISEAKKAFRNIGLYDVPDYGITPFGDEALFGSIRQYQRVRGLREDGVVKPGGETEKDLNRTLDELKTAAKSPTFRCAKCGGPHGGAFGRFCWWCWLKLNS